MPTSRHFALKQLSFNDCVSSLDRKNKPAEQGYAARTLAFFRLLKPWAYQKGGEKDALGSGVVNIAVAAGRICVK